MAKTKKKPRAKKKALVQKAVKHEIVLRVDNSPKAPTTQDLTEPIRNGNKLTIPKTWITSAQLIRMTERTPQTQVYKRPGKGGGSWDYVTVSYVQRVLDYVFGFNWDFEIVQHGKEDDHVWVLGKLTVRNEDGTRSISKQQFGRSEVKFKSGTKNKLDYGNDLKAAASDALKKCASMLGIARDVYGKTDYKAESGNDPVEPSAPKLPPAPSPSKGVVLKPGQVTGPDGKPTYTCSADGDPISEQVANYSLNAFGKRLCREHQVGARRKK